MPYIVFVFFVLLFSSCDRIADTTAKEKPTHYKLPLLKDSGYVNKTDGLHFLQSVSLTDTLDSYWKQAKESDTIGKYYRQNNGNYFVCLLDLTKKYTFETHVIIETNSSGELLGSERFFHGNYPCCWDNYYNGFNKYGDFFGIETCGTGSGFCGSYLYLFKKLSPQDEQKSIPKNYWASSGEGGYPHWLSSNMQFRQDLLIVHYSLAIGYFNEKDEPSIKMTKKIDVRYIFKANRWMTNDSVKLEELGM